MNKKVTIITVCYNSENVIRETINSVIRQNYNNIEYILVDGKSDDSTVDIIKEASSKIDYIKYISEKDDGIYDAMNKGLKLAEGDYIIFLNAGDKFCNNDVIKNISENFNENIDIVYGNIIKEKEGKYEKIKYSSKYHYKFIIGRTVCHQAMFINKNAIERYGNYDLNFKLASDYDFILRVLVQKGSFKYIDLDVVIYDLNGISAKAENRSILYNEYKQSIRKNLGKVYCFFLYKIKKRDSEL